MPPTSNRIPVGTRTPIRPASPTRPASPSRTTAITMSSRFAKAREAAQSSIQGHPFYSGEAKQALFDNLTPLYLVGVKKNSGQFGDEWQLVVSENEPSTNDDDLGTLSLKATSYRDSLFGQLAEDLKAVPEPIGPLMLAKVMTKSGQISWDVIEWDQDRPDEPLPF